MRIGRRQFLLATVTAALATLTRTASGADADAAFAALAASAAGAFAHPDLLDALGRDAVGEIGRRYRELAPDERDVAALHAAILAARRRAARGAGGRHPSLASLVADDFAAGRVALVDGWVLSVTEARQCALSSLLAA